MKSPTAIAAVILTTCSPAQASQTVHLHGGGSVTGEILLEKADTVVVDLGYRVLEIPRNAVDRIVETEAAEIPATKSPDLYRTEPGRPELSVEENIERCGEAVVQVRTPIGLGSGFVIHPSGYVVTNQHVISGEHQISITLYRRTEHELEQIHFEHVRIVALDPWVDLALLKIEDGGGHDFATAPLGDVDTLHQGQPVFAVGSPLGLDRSVSEGIISLTDRLAGGRLLIQTTAEVNPGNSGGPLFNLRGEVVGVNQLKVNDVGIEGLGFAIRVSTLKEFLRNRDAFAFDPRHPNAGFRYLSPPRHTSGSTERDE
ncbi:MAG: trypsin-like peptidase domain-containing protein [Thermoanaerobaculales bacterium]|jgi:serine protease Do|nr:trypsin-like peptidase domain-containing protein [Thermoanaerobaculales bacterium]